MVILGLFLTIKSITMFTNTNFIYDLAVFGKEFALATSGGLAIYDQTEKSFTVLNNGDGLPTNICYSVAVTPDTTIWLGTRKGLSRIDEEGIENYPLPAIVSADIRAIVPWGDTIFLGSSNGFLILDTKGTETFDDDELTIITRINHLVSDLVLTLHIDTMIWVGTDQGISRFHHDLSYDTSFTVDDGLPSGRILSLFGSDSILVGTDSGLAVIRNDSIRLLFTGEEIYDLLPRADTIFFASNKGFGIYYHGGYWHRNDSLSTKEVRRLAYIEGKWWIGLGNGKSHHLWGEGIAYYERYWHRIKNPGPNSNWISDIEIDDEGTVYLSHGYRDWIYCCGASALTADSSWLDLNTLLPDTIGPFHMTHRLAKDRVGKIWFIQNWEGGLIYYDPRDKKWGIFDSLKAGVPIRGAWDAEFDRDNNMIVSIAEPQGLASALVDSSFSKVTYLPGTDDFVVEIEVDTGRYWIAYNFEGLELIKHNETPFELSDDRVYYLTKSEGLLSVNGRDILTDGKGGLYYLCSDGLVYVTENNGVFDFTNYDHTNSPLVEGSHLYALTMDSLKRIWILSDVAIYCLDPDLNRWDIFYFSDLGLDLEFRPIEEFQNHGFYFDYTRGVIWFGSMNGLIKATVSETSKTTLDRVIVYPNPDTTGLITIKNLPDNAAVTIFSLSGRKLFETDRIDQVYKAVRWKWCDDDRVRSGIYLALIKTDSAKRTIKFALIR